ncbi:MAG: hypothetical protein WCE48_06930 [Steroidobacteraceae bacterium]
MGTVLLAALLAISIVVEREGQYRFEHLGGGNQARALVLFHPSRDAHFSDELSQALGNGLKQAGLSVDRATLTNLTPAEPKGYVLIAVVSNTYYWTPDIPTLRYLGRARFGATPVIGLIGGGGATARSQRMLDAALRQAGGRVLQTRSFWILRPNVETRLHEPNRKVALDLARQFGATAGRNALGASANPP